MRDSTNPNEADILLKNLEILKSKSEKIIVVVLRYPKSPRKPLRDFAVADGANRALHETSFSFGLGFGDEERAA